MSKIRLVKSQEGGFYFNKSYKPTDDSLNNIQVDFAPMLTMIKGNELTLVRLAVRYRIDEEKLLEYENALIFSVKEIKELENLADSELRENETIKKMLATTIGFTRGALFMLTKGTWMENLLIPLINVSTFSEHLDIIRN